MAEDHKEITSRLVDCHVHPHDEAKFSFEAAARYDIHCALLCCMSSNLVNQETTSRLATMYPERIFPAFGIHPWFCHALSCEVSLPDKAQHYRTLYGQSQELDAKLLEVLPDPMLLSDFLENTTLLLNKHSNAMIGEIGLDKSFKLPRIGGKIAPHSMPDRSGPIDYTTLKTPITHQEQVLEAQFDLAVEHRRNCSVHCVQAQGPMVALLGKMAKKHGSRWKDINIDLHSFGGSAETIEQLQKKQKNIYFSFSTIINARSPRMQNSIRAVSEDRLLIESDWNSLDGHEQKLFEVFEVVCEARGWDKDTA